MSGIQGPTPQPQKIIEKKGKAKQMVSRDDLIKAIQQMQLPEHKQESQQVYPPSNITQVWGTNG
jgi:hypothetical protein